jgi:thiamine-monophosphate kinase
VTSPRDRAEAHTALGPGREFDAIRGLIARWGPAARGLGDDCAVLDVPAGERLCVSTDACVEGVHFHREWLTPREIGARATAAALSDLAAMAARPLGLVVAAVVPPAWRADFGELADGVAEAATAAGAPILGGDTSAGSELTLTVTVLGSAPAPLARAGAQRGDRLYVTGTFGGPLAALRALVHGVPPAAADRARFASPAPRVREARWLAGAGARAAVDVSDGLAADLGHLAAASGVRVRLELDRVPCVPGIAPLDAARSGEEYELVVAAPTPLDGHAFAAAFGIPLTEVGRVLGEGAPGVEAWLGGARVDLPRGHDHFSE